MWLLRALVIVIVFVQCLWMVTAAGLPMAFLLDADAIRPAMDALSKSATGIVVATTAWEIGLSLAVLFFFVLALVRLIRRTKAFAVWFLGFVCLLALRSLQGIAADMQGASLPDLADRALANLIAPDVLYFNAGVLAFNLLIGVAILFVDGADARHWAAYEGETI